MNLFVIVTSISLENREQSDSSKKCFCGIKKSLAKTPLESNINFLIKMSDFEEPSIIFSINTKHHNI